MKKRLKYIWIMLLCFTVNAQISDFQHINFTKADQIAKQHKGQDIDNLSLLAHQLTHKLNTPVEKFRAIYTWVCTNIEGDLNLQYKIERKRKKYQSDPKLFLQWNKEFKRDVFEKLRKHRKTVCTGYAYLIKELCFLVNIECVIVNGYGRTIEVNTHELVTANHSWNAIKINTQWYLCDATWSSGYFDQKNDFVQDYNDGFFLADPILFHKNHFPLQEKWLFDKHHTRAEFIKYPLIYCEAFKYQATLISPDQMHVEAKKNEPICFRFQSSKIDVKDEVSLVYFIGDREVKMDIYNLQKQQKETMFLYQFKLKGKYDTHLKINNDIIATYTVKIHK